MDLDADIRKDLEYAKEQLVKRGLPVNAVALTRTGLYYELRYKNLAMVGEKPRVKMYEIAWNPTVPRQTTTEFFDKIAADYRNELPS